MLKWKKYLPDLVLERIGKTNLMWHSSPVMWRLKSPIHNDSKIMTAIVSAFSCCLSLFTFFFFIVCYVRGFFCLDLSVIKFMRSWNRIMWNIKESMKFYWRIVSTSMFTVSFSYIYCRPFKSDFLRFNEDSQFQCIHQSSIHFSSSISNSGSQKNEEKKIPTTPIRFNDLNIFD